MTATFPDMSISSQSLQYVRVAISEASGADPTADTVYMAFPVSGAEPSVYNAGSWVTINSIHYARCLVGTGGAVALPVGYYDVYVKITDSPEVPVLFSGVLEVT